MALTKYKLGELVQPFSARCGISNLTAWDVSGVNKDKEFFEPSKQVGADTSNYKVVPPMHFACNLMHVGRDMVLPVALNHTEKDKYVSPAYTIFRICDGAPVLREYFFLMLKCSEVDRYFWFHADASVRDGMSWEDFCDVEIALPPLAVQEKAVAVYRAMGANLRSYEQGLADLKRTCDALMDRCKHNSPKISVGDILREVDNRNADNQIQDVQGINIMKQFMPSVANTTGVDLSKYKLVHKGQFAFSGMQTGRDECIRIALFQEETPIIISPAYSVLEIKREDILPEYVMMWFSRDEVDRLGWFLSDGSIRTNLDMDRFYEIEIPAPPLSMQQNIVNIYKAYLLRKEIAEKLKAQMRELCPILIKGSLEEGEGRG